MSFYKILEETLDKSNFFNSVLADEIVSNLSVGEKQKIEIKADPGLDGLRKERQEANEQLLQLVARLMEFDRAADLR